MIYIKISDMDFYDDAVVLIKSFYPRTEVMQYQEQAEQTRTAQDIVIEPEVPEKDGRSKKELHEAFKCTLYTKLSAQLNKTLPWAILRVCAQVKSPIPVGKRCRPRADFGEFTKKHLVVRKRRALPYRLHRQRKAFWKNGL
mgnify:CR=1 FL=1